MSHYLGIDFGTSGCRSCVIDREGRVLAESRVALPSPHRDGDAVEQDPALWWQALLANLDRLAERHSLHAIQALCLDGTSATLLGTDLQGRPVTPALLYNDTRAREQAARSAALAPPDSPARGAGSSLAKLLWLLEQPAGRHVRHAAHQADWLLGQLCGRHGVSDENNALKLGYDAVARRWPDWLQALALPEGVLPQVVPAGQPIGTLAPAWARRWGLSTDTRVLGGTTDSTASFLATGAGPGEAVTALGSTLVLKIRAPAPVFHAPLGVYSHRLGQDWLVGGASNSGGAVLARYFTPAQIDALTQCLLPEQPTGLGYYPLPAPGERFPVCDPAMPPRLTPRPADDARFFQGILEGIAAIEAAGYRTLVTLGAPAPRRILTTGGGAVNLAWNRIRERLCGVPVVPASHQQAAYGSALLALHAMTGDRPGRGGQEHG
jgi:sugar (pentulose or hexulose) kinase